MYAEIIKRIAVGELRKQGRKLREKDANDTGRDDAGGRALEAVADGLDAIDLDDVTNPKSLDSIGKALEAAGRKLRREAKKAGEKEK